MSAHRNRRGVSPAFLATLVLATLVVFGTTAAVRAQNLQCTLQDGSCIISTNGANGINGNDASGDEPGFDGGLGTPASDITTNLDNLQGLLSSGVAISPINITAFGGNGGSGGNADGNDSTDQNRGGNGQPGSDGGAINATIGANTNGFATPGTTGLLISGVTIASLGGTGGGGGVASEDEGSQGNGQSGTGGNGQSVVATVGGDWQSTEGDGLFVASIGGNGGTGRSTSSGLTDGANGGTGGNASFVTATVNAHIIGGTSGVNVFSAGGDGGNGGNGHDGVGDAGGNGGNGGQAGDASATLAKGAQITMQETPGPGFVVGSYGGAGGAGGSGTAAGSAGAGGNAGNASATVDGQIVMNDLGNSYGVLVQSLGGVGGNGGRSGAWFNPQSGNGNQGGTAGTAMITGTGATVQTGVVVPWGNQAIGYETAVLAQSIGGGGGVGPSAKDGWFAVGGDGGDASPGNTASASLSGSTVSTLGFASSGIVAQSIGGGGGRGGDATKSDGAIVNMVVGGTGGSGGAAADAYAANLDNGTVTTLGDHSPGVVMQSIGGGGGAGGAGYGTSGSAVFGAAIAVGGAGGSGGDGGTANVAQDNNNSGAVMTSGAESFGILAQSIGGGGGSGGASTAKSIVFAGGDYPALSLALATGGSAGSGGSASAVYLKNSGFIATTGNGAAGMIGQAIGGGGGTGGDADGSSNASEGGYNFTATVTHGGNGGGGGDGADATGVNNGLIITRGESADGMLIQSIGGGGGTGGAGDALGSTEEQLSLATTIGLGGSAAGGGEGYNVTATNNGAILTLGDGSHGILAQTIGGGGGRGGGGASSASGLVGLEVAVGGSGGNGGDTYYNGSSSQVTNTGTIVTFGADAGGILAQSIGGGGGAGGKAGTTLGASTSNNDGSNGADSSVSGTIVNIVNNADNDYENAVAAYDNVKTLVSTAASMLGLELSDGDIVENLDQTASFVGSIDLSDVSSNNSFILSVGGKGGAGGAGGNITVTNSGSVATMGNLSDAIVAQSIGGGGGKGGAASSAASTSWLVSPGVNSGVSIGGGTQGSSSDPNATNGAMAVITNTSSIYTTGAIAAGLVAQSIGMGGGIGGTTTVTNTGSDGSPALALAVSVGGSSEAANGISEQAQVTSSGAIQTLGHDSYGIIAQSISGGGGIVKTLAADLDPAGGSANTASSKDFSGDISLGSDHGVISGYSGAAWVMTTPGGTITTSGDNGIGILAQSVAGGGGLALGGKPNGTTALDFLGSGGKTGSVNPGDQPTLNTGVIVEVGDDITTSGQGGVGVFAQSVGGGGGISGDIGWNKTTGKMTPNHSSFVGDGGDVKVTVDAGATITTFGDSSAGIIAQSVGGGGGWIAARNGAYIGSAGGTGDGYPISVTVYGAVDARGAASPGIFAQSTGGGDNGGVGSGSQISITVGSPTNSTASVWGGNAFFDAAAAVYFANGGTVNFPNQLINYGTIATHDTVAGTAVFGDGPYFEGTNYGQITGNIHLTAGDITNEGSGTIHTYSAVDLGGGSLDNAGKLIVGARNTRTEKTDLTGDYTQAASGKLFVETDHANGAADLLHVTGVAVFEGGVAVNPLTLTKQSVTVLTADGGLTLDEHATVDPTHLFSFAPSSDGTNLMITPSADFRVGDGSLTDQQKSVAAHLQRIWDSSNPAAFGEGFAALAAIEGSGYADTLDSLAGGAVNAVNSARLNASDAFVDSMQSCTTIGEDLLLGETECAWVRGRGGVLNRNGDSETVGYDSSFAILQAGGQVEVAPDWFLIGSLGYEHSHLTDDADAVEVDGNAILAGVGAKYQKGPWEISGVLDFGYGWYDSTRTIDFGTGPTWTAEGSPTSFNVGLHGRVAYDIPMETFYLRPRLDLSVNYLRMGGYSESGADPFDLQVESADKFVGTATPALEVGTRVAFSDGTVLRPYAVAGLGLSTDNDWTSDASFAGAPDDAGGFTTTVDNPEVVGKVALGVQVITAGALDVSLQYNADIAGGFFANTGSLKLTYRF